MFLITGFISLFLILFIRVPCVQGPSMEPTYHNGDRVVMFNSQNVSIGDVVAVYVSTDYYIIKRVVGLPGDKLTIRQDGFYRNDVLVSEPYVADLDWYAEIDEPVDYFVTDGHVFVMGDNRLNSKDSRYYGEFAFSDIRGVVFLGMVFSGNNSTKEV